MAAATQTEAQACNEALLYVGHSQTINDLDENTAAAKACKVFFAKTRDVLLEAFDWPFARKRATLAVIADGEQSGWTYAYRLPADCIAPRSIYPGTRTPQVDELEPFTIESSSSGATINGRILLTDKEDAELIYTAECATLALWTPLAIEALSWALAAKLALVLPVRPELGLNAKKMAALALREATAAVLCSQQPDRPPLSEFTTTR